MDDPRNPTDEYDVPEYFPPDVWEGKVVDFDYDESEAEFQSCSWKLGKKLHEQPRLIGNTLYKLEGLTSESKAIFECVDTDNEFKTALIQIHMQ